MYQKINLFWNIVKFQRSNYSKVLWVIKLLQNSVPVYKSKKLA